MTQEIIPSDPAINDCDRHGEDLLRRIAELTEGRYLGDNGWRVLLHNAAHRIRELESQLYFYQGECSQLQALNEALCERIAAAHEVVAKNAERKSK